MSGWCKIRCLKTMGFTQSLHGIYSPGLFFIPQKIYIMASVYGSAPMEP